MSPPTIPREYSRSDSLTGLELENGEGIFIRLGVTRSSEDTPWTISPPIRRTYPCKAGFGTPGFEVSRTLEESSERSIEIHK